VDEEKSSLVHACPNRAKTDQKTGYLLANETLYQLSYTPKEEQQLSWRNDSRQAIPKIVSNPICYYLSVERDELAKFAAFEFCGRSGVIDDKLSAVDWS